MDALQLKAKVASWVLSQAEFAQWVGVSPGAVTQWLSGARPVPGTVEAFIKLFESLPPTLQNTHLSRIRKGTITMEAMFAVEFAGSAGFGGASLTFKDGYVYGFDLGGGIYDGHYKASVTRPGFTDIEVNVKMPAGRPSVIRGIVQGHDWNVIAKATIQNDTTEAFVQVETNMGETVNAKFTRMRDLPVAA